MTKDQKKQLEQLERLCSALADDIDAMTDEEVLAELKEAGEDVSSIAHGARALVTDAAAKHGRHRLAEARASYEKHKASLERKVLEWPAERKRALLQKFVENDSALKQKLTLAARKGSDSQADMDSFLEDLIDLGLIDDKGNIR